MAGQGPTPMALGPFAFRALGFSFTGQGRDLATPWAEIEVCYRLDALQWTGPKSDSFTIKGCLFDMEFGGQASLDGVRAAALAGRPLMLVTFAGDVHGLHAILGVKEERDAINAIGQARKNSYAIELKRIGSSGGGIIAAAAAALGRLF